MEEPEFLSLFAGFSTGLLPKRKQDQPRASDRMGRALRIVKGRAMPRIRIPPDPPEKVFGLAEPSDMFRKLAWEICKLRDVLSRPIDEAVGFQTPAYHAFNCAVTAWHLADWIWESATKDDRISLLSHFDPPVVPSGDSAKDFGQFQQALMKRFRELHICRQLATGAKHKSVVRHPDPAIVAKEDWYGEPMRAGFRVGSRVVEFSPQFSVLDGETMRPAIEVFEAALAAWGQLLREWGYFEPLFVDPRED